jgi:hypothetical protein
MGNLLQVPNCGVAVVAGEYKTGLGRRMKLTKNVLI